MDDADMLRQAPEALKDPTLDMPARQRRVAAALAGVHAGGGPPAAPAGEPNLDGLIPTLPGR